MKIARIESFAYEPRYRHGEYVMSGGRAATAQEGTSSRSRATRGTSAGAR